jgi:uncharacterized membrane protein
MSGIEMKLNILIGLVAVLTIINIWGACKMNKATKEGYPGEYRGGAMNGGMNGNNNIFNPRGAMAFAERDFMNQQQEEKNLEQKYF